MSAAPDRPASRNAMDGVAAPSHGAGPGGGETLDRLQQLRDEVHHLLASEFDAVADDLSRLRALLGDAADRLSRTFRLVTTSTGELTRTVRTAEPGQAQEVYERLRAIADDMASTTSGTIQSLQFDDMASQMLQHVHDRLALLAGFSAEMSVINPCVRSRPPYVSDPEIDRLFEVLGRCRSELDRRARRTIGQRSLESGEIELF